MSAVITYYPYGNTKLEGEYMNLKVREKGD